ncbi:2-oxoglutarate dehydrogenase E1 subunit family protein, partial [Brachybacterium squillarum]|uniref:2-oxoglutarate dehydrogenase E1 subunit family protein n=1 Tax=Brachybacterium squillarum TaxID=661979 RepID=UPI002223DC1F
MSQTTQGPDTSPVPETPDFGPNQWLVDALREQWQQDPASVDPSWAEYFARSAEDSPAAPASSASTDAPTSGPARSRIHISEPPRLTRNTDAVVCFERKK